MMYKTRCFVCNKKGQVGFFSESRIPDGWILLSWLSRHSSHAEAVCSLECLHKFTPDEDDLPEKPYIP